MSKQDPYVISDPHFGHEKALEMCRPQFTSVKQMNEFIMFAWNSIVGQYDHVICCGDFAFNNHHHIIGELNGRITLVLGNHDNAKAVKIYSQYEHVKVVGSLYLPGKGIATHIPIHESQFDRWNYNLHGHTHEVALSDQRYVCCSVEQIDFRPVRLSSLLENRILD